MKRLICLIAFLSGFTLQAQEKLDPIWITTTDANFTVPQYKKMEWGFVFPKSINTEILNFFRNEANGLNPYDPLDLDLRITVVSPSGKSRELYGFFYQEFKEEMNGKPGEANYKNQYTIVNTKEPWRFRFAPDEEGKWTAKVELYSKEKLIAKNSSEITFNCVKSDHKGYLKISKTGEEKDRWMYYSGTGEPFFGIAANVTSPGEMTSAPSAMKRQYDGVKQFIAAGGNFVRLELGGQSAVPDFPDHNNYTQKLDELFAFDKLISLCEDNGVYMILFRHHVEVITRGWALSEWGKNPYNKDLKGTVKDYFTDEKEIKRWQLNSLRYQFARFCYSPNSAFYGFSEVDNWYEELKIEKTKNEETELAEMVAKWILMQKDYVRNNLHNEHTLFMNTFASVGHLWKTKASPTALSDVVGLHSYLSEDKHRNLKDRYPYTQRVFTKEKVPVFFEEIGLSGEFINAQCCISVDYHNDEWSTAFMGGMSIGMNWWWDCGIFDNNYELELVSIKNFFKGEDLRAGNFSPQAWTDNNNDQKRLLENYALVSENGERALGWIHNSTVYWRNLNDNQCLQNLITNKTDQSEKCVTAKDPHGFPNTGYDFPWIEVNMYAHNNVKGYDNPKYIDAYGKVIPINTSSETDKKTVTLEGFKSNPIGKIEQWYRIDFYSTKMNQTEMKPIEEMSQTISSSMRGKIEFVIPTLDLNNPDYAYKITYLGRYK